jgi:hypothetical protein
VYAGRARRGRRRDEAGGRHDDGGDEKAPEAHPREPDVIDGVEGDHGHEAGVSTAYAPYRENQLSAPSWLCLPTTISAGTGPRACAIPNEMAAAKAPLTRLNNLP